MMRSDGRSDLVVEFMGMSGVGKSTLIKRTHELLTELGIEAHRHLDRVRTPVRTGDAIRLLSDPTLARWTVSNRDYCRTEPGRLFVRSLAFLRSLHRTEGVHLVDEGPLKLGTTAVARVERAEVLVRHMPRPDVVVLVDCDPQERLARLRALNRLHTQGISDENLLARHKRGLERMRRFIDAYERPTWEFDTSGPTDHSEELAARITQMESSSVPR